MATRCRMKFLLIPLMVVFVASCVVHDKFPFICFRSGCVSQEYNLKGFKKRINGQLALKARKREAARVKSEKDKNFAVDTQKQSNDLKSENELSYGSKVIYSKYFLKFFLKKDTLLSTDSIIIFHTSEHRDITESDKPRLSHFIKKLPATNVTLVMIHQVKTDSIKEEMHTIIFREKRVKRFLKKERILAPINFQRNYK